MIGIRLLSYLRKSMPLCVGGGKGGGGKGGGGGVGGGKLMSPDKQVGFTDVPGWSESWSKTSVPSVDAAHVLLGCSDMLANMLFRGQPFLK